MKRFVEPAVARHFQQYPKPVRQKMHKIRDLIFATAAATTGVGSLVETLKWGEPAYLTLVSKSGSPFRIDWKANRPDSCVVYFHCQTNLVDTFRTLFANEFAFEGNRALLVPVLGPLKIRALRYCIAAALTYHTTKGTRPRALARITK